jgi:hypothetical protein
MDAQAKAISNLPSEYKRTLLTIFGIGAAFIPVVGPFISAGIGLADAGMYYQEGNSKSAGLTAVLSMLPFVGSIVTKIPGVKQLGVKGMAALASKLSSGSKLTKGEYEIAIAIKNNQGLINSELKSVSSVLSNVKGYVDKPSAVIISLREGSQDSKVRATIEFNISENLNTENEVKLKRTQTLGRFNKSLGDEWKKPLMMLDLKVGKLILYKLFDLPKVILSIGYKEFKSDSHFVENHYSSYDGYVNNPNRHLSWVDSRINNRPSRIMNDALPLINNDLNF